MQDGFDHPDHWGTRNNPHAEANMVRLLGAWRTKKRPIIHVQHHSTDPNSPLHPSQPGCTIKKLVAPWSGEEPVITKHVNSAFIGTDLEERLRAAGATQLVIVGLTTMHCVSTTARMAGNLGFDTIVVSDATAAFDRTGPDGQHYPAQLVHDVALAELHEEFATVLDTARVLNLAK